VTSGIVKERRAIRDRLTMAREHLQYAVENELESLGTIGQQRAGNILTEIQDELDDIETLIGDTEDE
jgi:hypothetical protein